MKKKKQKVRFHKDPALRAFDFPSLDGHYEEIQRIVSSLDQGALDGTRARLASYLMVDYAKCMLDVFAKKVGIPVLESEDIGKKYRRLSEWIPQVHGLASVIDQLDQLRGVIAHTDYQVPEARQVETLCWRLRTMRKVLEREARARAPGNSMSSEIERLLTVCIREADELKSCLGSFNNADERAAEYHARAKALRQLLHLTHAEDKDSSKHLHRLLQAEAQTIAELRMTWLEQAREQARIDQYLAQQERDTDSGAEDS